MGEIDALEVWVDSDLCTGCGNCVDLAPEVFKHVDGISYTHIGGTIVDSVVVPVHLEVDVRIAERECPGEIIYTNPVIM